MKAISFWAKHNPWKARLFIVLIHILLATTGYWVGNEILSYNIQLPAFLLFVFILLFIAAAIVYPIKKKGNYFRQKICDFTLAASSFFMIVCLANNQNLPATIYNSISASSSVSTTLKKEKPMAEEILASLKHRDKSTLSKTEKRILKKEFKEQLKIYSIAKVKGNKKDAGDAGLIILAIVAALGLLYLVAAISCGIACNGADGAAVVVAVLGTAAVILGLILVIKRINRGPRKKEAEFIQ